MSVEQQQNKTTQSDESIICGYCDNSTMNDEIVAVAAGKYLGTENGYAKIGGPNGGTPTIQRWHKECAEAEGFIITKAMMQRAWDTTTTYINLQTVSAFMLGLIIMLLIASVMIV